MVIIIITTTIITIMKDTVKYKIKEIKKKSYEKKKEKGIVLSFSFFFFLKRGSFTVEVSFLLCVFCCFVVVFSCNKTLLYILT